MGFSIIHLISSVLESVEHAIQFISELSTLLHSSLKCCHTFSKTDFQIIVPLVISFNDILDTVSIIFNDESKECSTSLVESIQDRFVISHGLHKTSVDVLLFSDLIGIRTGIKLVHSFPFHVIQPMAELVMCFIKVFSQWEGLLQNT